MPPRAIIAADPRIFGRNSIRFGDDWPPSGLADDLKLFATTFACGFLFVTVLIA